MFDADTVNAIADLAVGAADQTVGKVVNLPNGQTIALIPDGYKHQTYEPLDRPLTHVKQAVKFDSAESFSIYVNGFKQKGTTLLVSVERRLVGAIFDYHLVPGDGASVPTANHLDHRATYEMPFSEEWKRWSAIDGKTLPQHAFAEFIEENLMDIVEPAGADMLTVATSLQAKKKIAFESGLRLQDGSVQLAYKEETEHATRGNISVPAEFTIGIPVLFGGERYKVRCFLRYRIDEGKLFFIVVMNRKAFIVQDAVQTVAEKIGADTGIKPLYGALAS